MDLQPRKALPEERQVLAGALGDTPESVISVHLLARGLAKPTSQAILGVPMASSCEAALIPGS